MRLLCDGGTAGLVTSEIFDVIAIIENNCRGLKSFMSFMRVVDSLSFLRRKPLHGTR